MKVSLLLGGLVLLAGCGGSDAVAPKVVEIRAIYADQDTTELKDTSRKAKTVPLPDAMTCSGAFVGRNGDIITARHCVSDAQDIFVKTYDGKIYRADLVAISARHDLAALHIDRRNTSYFTLARSYRRGEVIQILGSPLSITGVLTRGIIGATKGDLFYVDCAALPGNSGGPVFNKDGELVGIIVQGIVVYAGTTHLNIAQGADSIYFFLRAISKGA